MIRRIPWVTLLITGSALLAAALPGADEFRIYDRQAILHGEFWRLFTGHWVHFSASHLAYDCLALGLAGWMCELRRVPHFGWLCLLAPWMIGLALLAFDSRLQYYGGLSGLATCALVYLCLNGLGATGPWKTACLLTLAGVSAKTGFELHTGRMLFATVNSGSVEVCAAAHLAGAATALFFYAASRSSSKSTGNNLGENKDNVISWN